jgi:hypothetical protein
LRGRVNKLTKPLDVFPGFGFAPDEFAVVFDHEVEIHSHHLRRGRALLEIESVKI